MRAALLRPVTQSLPASKQLLEDSNIPFSLVLSPYARIDDADATKKKQADTKSPTASSPIPAGAVARCSSCGATINPCSPLLTGKRFICGLCGHVTSMYEDSQLEHHLCNVTSHERELYRERYMSERSRNALSKYFARDSDSAESLTELNEHLVEFSMPISTNDGDDQFVSSVNAHDAPPLLIGLIDLEQVDACALAAACASLREALDSAPSFVRFGIIVFCGRKFSVFDLSSPCPHVKHLRMTKDYSTVQPSFVQSISISQAFPKVGEARVCMEAAIRALGDYHSFVPMMNQGALHRRSTKSKEDMPATSHISAQQLGCALSEIYAFIEDSGASHPGTSFMQTYDHSNEMNRGAEKSMVYGNDFLYAGGKIMAFLTSKPSATRLGSSNTSLSSELTEVANGCNDLGEVGRGGFGGSCAAVGNDLAGSMKFSNTVNNAHASHAKIERNEDNCDIEGGNQSNILNSIEGDSRGKIDEWALAGGVEGDNDEIVSLSKYLNGLGVKGATLAIAVEIFCLTSKRGDQTYSFNLPILRHVSERSGGCGPIIVDTTGFNDNVSLSAESLDANDGGTVPALIKEVRARCPWYRPCAFGGILRIRCSKSFGIYFVPDEPTSVDSNNGMFGACSADSRGEDLWYFGACDCDSTVTCDLEIRSSSGKLIEEDDFTGNHVTLKPCVQTAFAYTSIVPASNLYPCERVFLKDICEGVDSSDAEEEWYTIRRLRVFTTNFAVAKSTENLAASLDADALATVLYHKIMQSALTDGLTEARLLGKDWLISVLHSTYISAHNILQEIKNSRSFPGTDADEAMLRNRLVNNESTLSNRDILLACGHDRLSALPLLMFSLLQCDAFRSSGGPFNPSPDARSAAACALAVMSPSTLAKCIAPKIDMWEHDAALLAAEENIDLSREALDLMEADVKGNSIHGENCSGPLVVVDSPYQVVISYCNALPRKIRNDSPLGMHVKEICHSYRVSPSFHVVCCSNTENWRLGDALIEDSLLDGHDFQDWCTEVAQVLSTELGL